MRHRLVGGWIEMPLHEVVHEPAPSLGAIVAAAEAGARAEVLARLRGPTPDPRVDHVLQAFEPVGWYLPAERSV
jgi:hypothetical protein